MVNDGAGKYMPANGYQKAVALDNPAELRVPNMKVNKASLEHKILKSETLKDGSVINYVESGNSVQLLDGNNIVAQADIGYNYSNEPYSYYGEDDVAEGYMVYQIKADVMHVKEMVYLNMEAQRGLWDYISAHYSMIEEVRGYTYRSELMAFILEDGNVTETIRPYMMARIVDVEQFFVDYRTDGAEADVVFAFEVEDSFLEWNNRTFCVLFHGGRAEVTDMEPDYTVSLSIGSLTTMLMGYMTASQLARLERLKAEPEAVEALDEILIHEIPYISDYL